jgi:hypothetical protein
VPEEKPAERPADHRPPRPVLATPVSRVKGSENAQTSHLLAGK